jgi:glutamate-1-semialdehyde 2,1-aminomutase
LKKPGFYEAVNERGRRLRAGLESRLKATEIPAQVVGEATVFQPWFTREALVDHRSALRADSGRNRKFVDLLLRRGIVKAHEKFFVSAAHSDEDVEITLAALEGALAELRESERAPAPTTAPRARG